METTTDSLCLLRTMQACGLILLKKQRRRDAGQPPVGQPSLGTPRMALGEERTVAFGILLHNCPVSGSGRVMIASPWH